MGSVSAAPAVTPANPPVTPIANPPAASGPENSDAAAATASPAITPPLAPAPTKLTLTLPDIGRTLCLSVLQNCAKPRAAAGVGTPGIWGPDKPMMNTPDGAYLPPLLFATTSWNTISVPGVKSVEFTDAKGQPLSAQTVAAEFAAAYKNMNGDKLAGVTMLLGNIQHGPGAQFTYVINNNLIHVRANPSEGLEAAPASRECDWFANTFAYMAVASGILKPNEVKIFSERGVAGGHTLAGFSLDGGKTWNIANNATPAALAVVGAASPAMALHQYFKNGGLMSISHPNADPSKNPIWEENVSSWSRAIMMGLLDQPGIDGLVGRWGSPDPLNSPTGPKIPNLAYIGGTVGLDHARAQYQGLTAEVRYDPGTGFAQPGFNSFGLSYNWIDGDNLSGVKAAAVREPTGGQDYYGLYEHYHISEPGVGDHSKKVGWYWGFVGGVQIRNQILSEEAPEPLTSIGPVALFNIGFDGNIVGDRKTPFQLSYFNSIRLGGGLPFVLGSATDKAQIDANSNGLDKNGWYDPGFLSLLDGGGKSGFGLRWNITPSLTLRGMADVYWEINDPSVSFVPHMALEGKLNLQYEGPKLSFNVGGTVTPGGPEITALPGSTSNGVLWHMGGIYDRDPLAQFHWNGAYKITDTTSLAAQVALIDYTSGDTAAIVGGGARTQVTIGGKKIDLTLTGGVFAAGTTALPTNVRPFLNLGAGLAF